MATEGLLIIKAFPEKRKLSNDVRMWDPNPPTERSGKCIRSNTLHAQIGAKVITCLKRKTPPTSKILEYMLAQDLVQFKALLVNLAGFETAFYTL